MNDSLTIVGMLQELMDEPPHIRAAVIALFNKADPTPADWEALHRALSSPLGTIGKRKPVAIRRNLPKVATLDHPSG